MGTPEQDKKVSEEKKKRLKEISKYTPIKKTDPINRLLLYLPTKHVKALKISLVLLFILIPILLILIIIRFKNKDYSIVPLIITLCFLSTIIVCIYYIINH
jgi:Mn2+/Fe2+ NRAMP family transporter